MTQPLDKSALHEKLSMPSLEETKREAEQALRPKPAEAIDSPKMAEKYRFTVDHEAAGGRRYKGEFVNRILSIGDRRLVGIMRARQSAGVAVESLTLEEFQTINYSCWVTLSLEEKPEWFADPDKLLDPSAFFAVVQEVTAHEATFHGSKEPGQPGASAG